MPSETKKARLELSVVPDKEGLFVGIKSDGKPYTVRKDRHRYFFPDEWLKFISNVKGDKKFIFETLIQTGARIEEALNIRPKDFNFERRTLELFVTKSKAKKGQTKEMGGHKRGFVVSSEYLRRLRKYINYNRIPEDDYLFVIVPDGFEAWTREEKKRFFKTKQVGISSMMKRALEKSGLRSWEFSLHNIRKTHGMWLKALIPYSREITEGEICMRLGHDMNTFLKHYGSPSIFNERDKSMIIKILNDIYGLR